jgi:hypothetical protein
MGSRFEILHENILCKENFFKTSFAVVDKFEVGTHC